VVEYDNTTAQHAPPDSGMTAGITSGVAILIILAIPIILFFIVP
jgi:hypothetical protein